MYANTSLWSYPTDIMEKRIYVIFGARTIDMHR